MATATPVLTEKPQSNPSPWPWFLLLILITALTDHRYDFSLQENLDGDADAFQASVEQGSNVRRAAYAILGFAGIVTLLRGRRLPMKLGSPLSVILIGAVVWSFASLLWSEDPPLTFRRLFILGTVMIAIVALTAAYSGDRIPQYAAIHGVSLALVGLGCEIGLRTFLPFSSEYRFSGTVHPNSQSVNAALAAFGCFALLLHPETRRRWQWIAVAISIVAMLLTKSRTPVIAGGTSVLLFGLTVGPRRASFVAVAALAWIGAASFLFIGQGALAAGERGLMLGRESEDVQDLTGRYPLWAKCMEYVEVRPFTGYGYQSFWDVDHIRQISESQEWSVKEAHNAYLQVTLDLGLPGLLLFASAMVAGMLVAYVRYRREPTAAYAFCAIALGFGLIQSATESSMVEMPAASVIMGAWCLAFLALRPPARPVPLLKTA
jgi:O-antigen ligase